MLILLSNFHYLDIIRLVEISNYLWNSLDNLYII